MLVASKIASKCHHENILNKKFACDKSILCGADTVTSVHHLIDKGMYRELSVMWRVQRLQDHQGLCQKS